MSSLQVDILNPKAGKLLKQLAAMDLIAIREMADDGFMKLVNKLRRKAKDTAPSLDEITKEVETVRASRYAKAQGQGNH